MLMALVLLITQPLSHIYASVHGIVLRITYLHALLSHEIYLCRHCNYYVHTYVSLSDLLPANYIYPHSVRTAKTFRHLYFHPH
jgi:hypothetical protein